MTQQPRDLLAAIPGVTLVEIAEAELCCGSAGTYNLEKPELARQPERKAGNVGCHGRRFAATGNIGCMTQLRTHLPPRIDRRRCCTPCRCSTVFIGDVVGQQRINPLLLTAKRAQARWAWLTQQACSLFSCSRRRV
ncbi:MAG: (Fe-S)-binding protein [Caldilineaceae bacterium]